MVQNDNYILILSDADDSTAEAALVGAENIVHNKNMNQLLNNLAGMWEKIK